MKMISTKNLSQMTVKWVSLESIKKIISNYSVAYDNHSITNVNTTQNNKRCQSGMIGAFSDRLIDL